MLKPFREYHLLQLFNQLDSSCPLDLAISKYFRAHKALGSKDRKFIAETSYKMIRWLGLIDYFITADKNWESRLESVKQLNLEQALEQQHIPIHIRASFPKVLFTQLVKDFGEAKAFEIGVKSNQRAPLTIRINEQKITREMFLERFKVEWDLTECNHSSTGATLKDHLNLFRSEAFKEGLFEVQDEASQLTAQLVEAKPQQKVLDFCCGSGGKSLAFAPGMKNSGCIFAHDIRLGILKQAKKRFKRAGVQNYQIVEPQSTQLKQLKQNMDWVLVDAPCSGSGTYRRNPDLKWKFSEEMLTSITQQQREIFDEAIQYLKPKGYIVYATCSLLKRENEEQVQFFMEKYKLKLASNPLNSSQELDTMDGFYGAVLCRC